MTNNNPIKEFEYIKIVDEMSEAAFRFCVDILYPEFEYHFIKREDVRKIDLKEKLYEIIYGNIYYQISSNRGYNLYMSIVEQYIETVIWFKAGSRADLYKKRILEIIHKDIKTINLLDIDDLFFLFSSIVRFSYKLNYNIIDMKFRQIDNVDFNLNTNDAEMFKRLRKNTFIAPKILVHKQGIIDKKKNNFPKEKKEMKIFYINNILLLSRALDNYGALSIGDDI